MDILAACIAVLREQTMREGKTEVLQAIEYLRSTRSAFPLIVADREWLFNFIVSRPDLRWRGPEVSLTLPVALFEGTLTEQDIWEWIDEALPHIRIHALPVLPETSDQDLWCAVMLGEELYCCECRSRYEGIPLTESQVDGLRDERIPFCAECGGDL